MKPKMRIAVDLDGVLADTMVTFCRILNRRHSSQLTVESFISWNAWETAHITKDEFYRTLDEAWFDWKTIPPTEQNIAEKIGQIHQFGRVDIVTARSRETVPHATLWLRRYQVPYDAFVRTESTKSKVNLDYDLFIDDSPDLMALLTSKLDSNGILYTQPWNKDAPKMSRIFRVQQWDDIPAVLHKITDAKTRS